MLGFRILLHIPLSLFLFASLGRVTGAPVEGVELRQLTPENFKTSVAQGVWCVDIG